jgi:hypothetical protein
MTSESETSTHGEFETHSEQQVIEKDTTNTPSSDTDTEALQNNSVESSSGVDGEIDEDAIKVLPGTGGPDDEGDIEIDPGELRL